jgi:hypothetical protein
MLKGLFYKRLLLLATGTIVAKLMIGYAFTRLFTSRERLRQLLVALGQDPGPVYISPYENGHVWNEDEWEEWLKKGSEQRRREWIGEV